MKHYRQFKIMIFLAIILQTSLSAQKVDVSQWPEQSERIRDYDAFHYRIHLKLDIKNKIFTGQTTVILTPLHDDFQRCVLDAEDFTVS